MSRRAVVILVGSEPCSDDDGGVDDDDDWEGDKGYDRDAATAERIMLLIASLRHFR